MNPPHDWITPDWPAPTRVRSLITTRNGGVSSGAHASFNLGLKAGDDAPAVHANRAILRMQLPREPAWLRQVTVLLLSGCANSRRAACSA